MSAPFIYTSFEIVAFERPRNFIVLLIRLVSQSVRWFFRPIDRNLFTYKASIEMELMFHARIW